MKSKSFIFIALIFLILISCKNYYNETIDWADEIKIGTDIETVKKSQPNFVEISWEKPLIIEDRKLYEITEVEGNYDVLNMQNFLVFKNGNYEGREAKK